MGMYEEALSELQITLKLRGDSMECAWLMGHIYARSGKIDEAREVLDQLIEQSKNRYVLPCGFAFIHAALCCFRNICSGAHASPLNEPVDGEQDDGSNNSKHQTHQKSRFTQLTSRINGPSVAKSTAYEAADDRAYDS